MLLTQLLSITSENIQPIQNFVAQLYETDVHKARLQNVENAEKLVVVTKESEILGVLSLHKNPSYPEKLILGNYQCVDTQEVANALLAEAFSYGKQQGYSTLLGPMNCNTWNSYRFSLEADNSFFLEHIHKAYYPSQWLSFGFTPWATYQSNIETLDPDLKLLDYEAYFREKGLTIRSFKTEDATHDLGLLHSFCMELFANNVLFSPIDEDAFIALYQPILPFFNTDFITMAFDEDKLVGLFFAIPDAYVKTQIIVKTIARNPSPKYKGLANIMASQFYQKALEQGFSEMINAYFHIDNKSSRVSSNYGGRHFKTHKLYSKIIE